jgi:hypothetical protein
MRRQLLALLMELSRTGNANLSPELDGLSPNSGGPYCGLPFPHGGNLFRAFGVRLNASLEGPPSTVDGDEVNMNSKLIALASAATMALAAVAIPNQAEARWRGGGWWVPGAVIGGLALGAVIASRPYYYGGGPYYYGGGPYYGGGYYGTTYRNWREY